MGRELAINSRVALGGMVGIPIYVTTRFECPSRSERSWPLFTTSSSRSVSSHFLGRELSLVIVGAILTIAGYR